MLTVNSLHCLTEVVRGGEAGGAAAGLLPTTELRCLSLLGMIQWAVCVRARVTMWTLTLALQLALLSTSLSPLLGLTAGSALHCAVRREISPCTCKHQEERPGSIQVTCERMSSFVQVIAALKDRFEEDVTISLTVAYSKLEDLPLLSFQKLGLNVYTLKLNHDNLR